MSSRNTSSSVLLGLNAHCTSASLTHRVRSTFGGATDICEPRSRGRTSVQPATTANSIPGGRRPGNAAQNARATKQMFDVFNAQEKRQALIGILKVAAVAAATMILAAPASAFAPAPSGDAQLAAIAQTYFHDEWQFAPSTATRAGVHDFD